MSRRLSRISLVLVVLLASEVWALGLGDITMNSALNEPLNARIDLLSATPEELDALTIALASEDTFARYGIDRPFYLQDMQFNIVRSGRADGNFVQVTSVSPMAEPFLTFLVEASWSRGRLLREYTVFLDPPTFAPPVRDAAPAVQAPTRTAPADSARIERSAPPPAPAPQQRTTPAPRPAPQPAPQPIEPAREAAPEPIAQPEPVAQPRSLSVGQGVDYLVERGDTLWGLAARIRPDSRLTMNQTMLAIFEANPDAFGGNINLLRAGATVRIPDADEIFRIDRADALAEAQRQHAEWGSGPAVVADTSTGPSLTLVPPDEDFGDTTDTFVPEPEPEPEPELVAEPYAEDMTDREREILDRIAELESADVPQQQSLIEIRDNELAQLRDELSRIRAESLDPFVDESLVDEGEVTDEIDEELVADSAVDETADETAVDAIPEEATPPADVIRTPTRDEPGLVDQIIGYATGIYGIIAAAIILVIGALVWFMRRSRGDEDIEDWEPFDRDEMAAGGDISPTESMAAPTMDESIVVVEEEPAVGSLDDTIDASVPAMDMDETEEVPAAKPPLTESFDAPAPTADATGTHASLEDTFSSETAINLDQSDPIAEADFHMAYGLYDQAADLVNGALSVEPERTDLLTKLCEIYFVWGNRDAFIDAAGRLKSIVGGGESADWDKIVIMGQQIAADDALFAGASAAGATKAVDLAFDEGGGETGALDMDFGDDDGGESDVFDIGAEDVAADGGDDDGVDFVLESTGESEAVLDITAESPTAESPTVESTPDFDITREMEATEETTDFPPADDDTVEASASDETAATPTIEEQFDVLSGTSELPSLDDTLGDAIESSGQAADETAEINLDELGLDVDSMAETELASLDDPDSTGRMEALEDTGLIEEVAEDLSAVTGKNPELDVDATGTQQALSGDDDTSLNKLLEDTGLQDAPDEKLLDATGVTQVLSSDLAVDTTTDAEGELGDDDKTMLASDLDDDSMAASLSDDAETLLASLDDDADSDDFDFAKTEALPKDAFTGEMNLDETGEMPAVASTDVELDLDDLTAALEVSDAGDTVEQPRDDATVEQPRPTISDDDDMSGTVSLGADEMSDDLSDARTMTEVGTKLDLARAYVDMGDPGGARSILEEVLDEGDDGQRQQAQQLLDSLPS